VVQEEPRPIGTLENSPPLQRRETVPILTQMGEDLPSLGYNECNGLIAAGVI
jgi:hypothetical protein